VTTAAPWSVLRYRLLALPAILVIAVSGCTNEPPASMPATVAIGVLADGGNDGASAGIDVVRGAELAVDVVNGAFPQLPLPLAASMGLPGLRGARVTLAIGDTRGDPTEMSDIATALVTEEHVVTLIVADTAEVAAAAGSEAQRLAIPVIDAASSADYVTELGLDWYFRVGPTDHTLAETAFAVLRGQLRDPARIALLTPADGADAAAAALVTDLATRSGDTVVMDESDGREPTIKARTSLVAASVCDVIFAVAGAPADAADALRIASELQPPVPVLGLGPGFDRVTRDTLAPTDDKQATTAPVVLRAVPWSVEFARRSPTGRAVADLYQQKFDVPMTAGAAISFTTTMAAAAAIDAAGGANPADVRNALRRLSLPATQLITPWNGLRFDANGQNALAAAVIEGWSGVDFRVVYPRELAAGPMIWSKPR
jgi:branched-chain amino acid transport system substrate-binding protein